MKDNKTLASIATELGLYCNDGIIYSTHTPEIFNDDVFLIGPNGSLIKINLNKKPDGNIHQNKELLK
jgi:hypothetical protein